MAERKKATGSSSETEAKREAESKSTGKGGGSREAKKAEAKGGAKARKKASPKPKAESKGGAKGESKSGGAKAASKTADPKAAEKSKAPGRKAPAKKPAAKPKQKQEPKPKQAPERPVVNASARFVRVAPRKARLLADQVRGLPLEDAKTLLRFSPRSAARDISKLLDSAAANAENNHDLVADELRIADLRVDEGPVLRRYRPRALGRATRINKRTSHIKVALTPEE